MFKNLMIKKRFLLIIAITITLLIINYVVLSKKFNEIFKVSEDNITTSIPDKCKRKFEDIHIAGTWEYLGEEMPNWRFEFLEDKTFKYFTGVDNFISSGKWEYNEQDNTITIIIQDQFDYWKKEFFNNPEQLAWSTPGITAMNIDNYSLTFLINEFRDSDFQGFECGILYKSIVLYGLELIKFQ